MTMWSGGPCRPAVGVGELRGVSARSAAGDDYDGLCNEGAQCIDAHGTPRGVARLEPDRVGVLRGLAAGDYVACLRGIGGPVAEYTIALSVLSDVR